MPKVFTEWTVLPHRPIEKLADNLWRVSGKMGEIQRQMVLARMADGRVVVDNAIALDDAEMAEIEAWGEPRVLIVPNGYHRQDAVIWKQRYPRSTVVAPPRGRKRIEKLMPVDLLIGEAPADDTVRIVPMDGCASDTLLEVRSGDAITLVFCDAILNVPRRGGLIGFILGPTGRVSTPRIQRWIGMQDKRAFAAHMERLAATPHLARLLFGHGPPVTDNPGDELRRVAAQLRG
ncbi:MAG: hypothetical protein E6J90_33825 [Deltaproteobacteria bacterium]|nr:MAG: hypothetical protein E6J90_33825 [Deltaproteobacteria bacterium]